jgi:hypothetical protein
MNCLVAALLLTISIAPPAAPPTATPPPPAQRQAQAADRVAEVIADRLPQLHGSATWRQKTAVQFDLKIEMGGKPVLDGTMTCETNRRRARIDLKDGGSLIFDGYATHVASTSIDPELARTHLEIWPKILAIPFQLRDRSVQPAEYKTMYLKSVAYDSIKLFHKSPDGKETGDFRVVFSHPKDFMIRAIGNVPLQPLVNSGSPDDRYALTLDDYTEVEGVKLATRWMFWKWGNDLIGEPIGNATLSSIKFVVPADGAFDKPTATKPDESDANAPAAKPN